MISVEGLKVEFGVKPLFHDVSFVINDRDRIALVGKNGAGKSTMLKILCGLQKPTDGIVAIPNETTIGYLHQNSKALVYPLQGLAYQTIPDFPSPTHTAQVKSIRTHIHQSAVS